MKSVVPFAMKMRIRIRPTILLFGDSITEFAFGLEGETEIGWASLLASTYSRRADILSRGFSGYNTKHALGVLPSILGTASGTDGNGNTNANANANVCPPLLFCTVFFGANDASMPSARQYLDIDEYTDNIRQIVTKIRSNATTYGSTSEGEEEKKSSGDEDAEEEGRESPVSKKPKLTSASDKLPIVLLTPPPVASSAWDHYCTVIAPRPLSPRSNENAKLYGARVLQLAKELDCAVVDTFNILGGNHEEGEKFYGKYLTDGLHLNEEGNRLVYRGIMDALKSKGDYAHLLPSTEDGGTVSLEEKLWSELC